MKHISGGVCKFAALLLMFALPAVASAPIFTVNPAKPFVQPAGPGGCSSFDVSVVPQAGRPNNAKTITFANGSQVLDGAVFETLTNLTNFKSISLNISGPGQFSASDNTITLFGPQLLFGFVAIATDHGFGRLQQDVSCVFPVGDGVALEASLFDGRVNVGGVGVVGVAFEAVVIGSDADGVQSGVGEG